MVRRPAPPRPSSPRSAMSRSTVQRATGFPSGAASSGLYTGLSRTFDLWFQVEAGGHRVVCWRRSTNCSVSQIGSTPNLPRMFVDIGDHGWRSSSAPKKAAADFKSHWPDQLEVVPSNSLSRCFSSVVNPGRPPVDLPGAPSYAPSPDAPRAVGSRRPVSRHS